MKKLSVLIAGVFLSLTTFAGFVEVIDGNAIPDGFLSEPTYYVNNGGVAPSYAQYFPGTQKLVLYYPNAKTPMNAAIREYQQTFHCTTFNTKCEVISDELGFAKSLVIFQDGTMLYQNNYSILTVMYPEG